MAIYIDVEDASGNRFDDGPITTVVDWQSMRKLDGAGTFFFRMPASDPRSNMLKYKRLVRCWSSGPTGVVEHGAGIIDRIVLQPQADGLTMLEISGDDLLRELVNRQVDDLDLLEEIVTPPTQLAVVTYFSNTPLTLPANVNLDPQTNFLVIAYPEAFTEVDFELGIPVNNVPCTLRMQYYNAISGGWESLSGVHNTTLVSGKPFAQSGTLTFSMPGGWGVLGGEYNIRIFSDAANLSAFRLNAVNVHVRQPTANALQMVMAKTPPGWSLDAAGAFATENDVYLQIQGGSVLAALVRLSEQTGEHFTLGASGRRVRWLGSAQLASGLRAIAASEPDHSTMVLTELNRSGDTYEMYNRIYVSGGGTGVGKLTLAGSDRDIPAGYALNASESYLECTDAQDIYGRIDRRETFSDIAPVDISASAKRNAANSLFDRAYQLLRRKCEIQEAYSLSVIPARFRLYPGQTVYVSYHEWNGVYHAVNIDAELVVLETVEQIDANQGILTVALTVATVDYWPSNDYRTTAQELGSIVEERNLQPPQTGLESFGAGIPTYLAVQGGAVTAIRKTIGVPDGSYTPVDTLVFKDGVIVAVNP